MENQPKTSENPNNNPQKTEGKKVNKFRIVLNWIFGILFVFWGLLDLIQGFFLIPILDFIWAGTFIPPVKSFILRKTKINLTQQKKTIIWIIFFIVSMIVWQNKPEEPDLSLFLSYTQQGQIKRESTNISGALEDFNKALQLDPKNHIALIEIANIKFQEEKLEEALKYYNEALKIDNTYFNTYYNRGLVHSELKHFQEAIVDFQKATDLNPEHAASYRQLGLNKYMSDDFIGALSAFNKAIELKDPSSYALRGSLKISLGNYNEALQDLNTFLQTDPSSKEMYFNKGYLNFFLEENKAAINNFDKAIEIDTNYSKAYAARGIVKAALGDMNGSREDHKKSIQLDPSKETEVSEMNGFYKYKFEDFEGSLTEFNKSINLEPNNPLSYYYRGLVQIELKKTTEACTDFLQSNNLGFIPAKEAIKKFNCSVPKK